MFLAINTLSATAQWIIYLIAMVLFLLSAIGFEPRGAKIGVLGLGLAFFTFPLFWNNLAAS
jgi:hypothetical protein